MATQHHTSAHPRQREKQRINPSPCDPQQCQVMPPTSREILQCQGCPPESAEGNSGPGLCITSATLTQPALIIPILQARDSSTEMQHTHKTTQHTFSTTWNDLNIISFFSVFLYGHRNTLIGGNIYNMKLLG